MEAHERTGTVARTLDAALARFLRDITRAKEESNFIIIFMSDHGLHYGDVAKTYYEVKGHDTPPLFAIVPRAGAIARRRSWEAATQGAQTVFDVGATLRDLAAGAPQGADHDRFGRSFFQQVQAARSCSGARTSRYCSTWTRFEQQRNATLLERLPKPYAAGALEEGTEITYPIDPRVQDSTHPTRM
jgi:arylsulfatase A-like enzyme